MFTWHKHFRAPSCCDALLCCVTNITRLNSSLFVQSGPVAKVTFRVWTCWEVASTSAPFLICGGSQDLITEMLKRHSGFDLHQQTLRFHSSRRVPAKCKLPASRESETKLTWCGSVCV